MKFDKSKGYKYAFYYYELDGRHQVYEILCDQPNYQDTYIKVKCIRDTFRSGVLVSTFDFDYDGCEKRTTYYYDLETLMVENFDKMLTT